MLQQLISSGKLSFNLSKPYIGGCLMITAATEECKHHEAEDNMEKTRVGESRRSHQCCKPNLVELMDQYRNLNELCL